MPHPGLAMMVVVGVGLGAVLYYFLASTPDSRYNNRQQEINRSHDFGQETRWSSQSPESRNYRRRTEKCTICYDQSNVVDKVLTIPCKHIFHKLCIEEWMKKGVEQARRCCPVCRYTIEGLENL